MKVLNIHKRIIDQPKLEMSKLFETLSSKEDKMLAINKWPPMKLDKGLQVGSKGGHGLIGYFVTKYKEGEFIQFQFTKPRGFNGIHEFKITELDDSKTEIKHIVDVTASGVGIFTWSIAIRWLHDAYIEDALDRVENHFLTDKKKTEWNLWVKFLRKILKPKKRSEHKKTS